MGVVQQLPMLYAAPFCSVSFIFRSKGWIQRSIVRSLAKWGRKIYSFFGGGEKGNGKSSFANGTFAVDLAICKCAFAINVDFCASFQNAYSSFLWIYV